MNKTILSMALGVAISFTSLSAMSADKVKIGVPSWTGAQAIALTLIHFS